MRNSKPKPEEKPTHVKSNPPESQNGYQKKVSDLNDINPVYTQIQEPSEDHSPVWGVHSPLKRSKPKAEDLFEYEE